MLRRTIVAITAAAALAGAVPTAALAHECYNASRSEKGNEGAANSQRWLTIQRDEFFTFAHEFLPVQQLTPAQVAQASALATAEGIPATFTIFVSNRTLAEGTPAAVKHAADGNGVDHLFAAYGERLVAIVFAVGTPA
jgi:hypothetical protein